MGRAPIPICGYGQVLLYRECESYQEYEALMDLYPEMKAVTKGTYAKTHKTQYRLINSIVNYTNHNKEKFLTHFSRESWATQTAEEKAMHQFSNCPACMLTQHLNVYATLRRNATAIRWNHFRSLELQTSQAVIAKHHSIIPSRSRQSSAVSSKPTKARDPILMVRKSTLPRKVKKTVQASQSKSIQKKRPVKKIEYPSQPRQKTPLPPTQRELEAMRRAENGEPKVVRTYRNAIDPNRFKFDRPTVKQEIVSMLDSRVKISWMDIARRHEVVMANGKPALHAYSATVIKAFAISEGLIKRSEKRRVRKSKLRIEEEEKEGEDEPTDIIIELPMEDDNLL